MTPTGGVTPLPFSYDAPSPNVRRESGRARVWLVQPAPHPVLSACEGSLPLGGQVTMNANAARRTRTPHTRSAPPHCTTTTATSATGLESYLAVLPRLRPAAGLVTAATEGWRGCLPPQVLRYLGRHCQSSLLHCTHHICTGFRQSLTSWVPPATKCSTRGTLYLSPRPGYGGFTALHMRTTATPKHGSTSGSPHCCCRITSG